jgi:hypothetical protein
MDIKNSIHDKEFDDKIILCICIFNRFVSDNFPREIGRLIYSMMYYDIKFLIRHLDYAYLINSRLYFYDEGKKNLKLLHRMSLMHFFVEIIY